MGWPLYLCRFLQPVLLSQAFVRSRLSQPVLPEQLVWNSLAGYLARLLAGPEKPPRKVINNVLVFLTFLYCPIATFGSQIEL